MCFLIKRNRKDVCTITENNVWIRVVTTTGQIKPLLRLTVKSFIEKIKIKQWCFEMCFLFCHALDRCPFSQ